MLNDMFDRSLQLGLAQSVASTVLALAVVFVARWQAIHMERDSVIGLVRAFIQIVAVGMALVVLLRGPQWTAILVLLAMVVAAAVISAKRAKEIPGVFLVSLYSIGVGSGVVIILMTWVGVIDPAITSIVPVGSMLINRALITNGLALNRFVAEIKAHTGIIETGLALGASSKNVAAPYVQSAAEASLIPAIDSLVSLGIVWIPGLMAGMILAGEDPIYAAIYQFVIMAMTYAVAGLTAIITTVMVRSRVFSSAEQLLLRPGTTKRK